MNDAAPGRPKRKRPNQRLVDIARVLPVAGGVLILVPLLWPKNGGGTLTSKAAIYVFLVWLVMIAAAAAVAWAMNRDQDSNS